MKTKKSDEDSHLIKKSNFKLSGRGKQVVSFFCLHFIFFKASSIVPDF